MNMNLQEFTLTFLFKLTKEEFYEKV